MKNKIKKMLAAFLTMIFCLSITISVFASQEKQSLALIESNVANFIAGFYESKDMGIEIDSNINLSEDISLYLDDKIEVQKYATELYEIQKENYNVEVILNDFERENNNIIFKFQVITTFNYVNADFETTNSEDLYVCYDCLKNEIVNFYAPQNYFDIAYRDTKINSENLLSYNSFNITKSSINMKEELIRSIDDVYEMENNSDFIENIELNVGMSPLAISTINQTAVANYARNNFNKSSPASGSSSVSYYDFSTISGNYDCTNFVSHALLAGGAKVNDTGGSGISSSGWYFRNISNRSSSWSGVENLYTYLTTNTKTNAASGNGFTYTLNGAYWGVGHVLQFKASGASSYGHSTIITQKKYSNDGTRSYAYVTGRTSKTSYNNNTAAADMFPNGAKRTIQVYNK